MTMVSTSQPKLVDADKSSASYPAIAASSSKFSVNRFIARSSSGTSQHQYQSSANSSSASVRVVGRGGVGSRPRNLPLVESAAGLAPRARPAQPVSPRRVENTRIMGRGGAGARPRQLEAELRLDSRPTTSSPDLPIVVPSTSALTQNGVPPLVYRPTGRGGAGSRQPKPKSPPDPNKTPRKGVKVLWKGKGREMRARPLADVETLTENALTRTDSIDTLVSEIAFAPAPSPAPIARTSPRNADFNVAGARSVVLRGGGGGISKLARTLGMDTALAGIPLDGAISSRAMRRASISTLSTLDYSVSERRLSLDFLDLDMGEWERSTEAQRRTSTGPPLHLAYVDAEPDARSDTTATDGSSVIDTSDTHSLTTTSTGTAQLHAHPSFSSDVDDDGTSTSDAIWSRSATPRPMSPFRVDEDKTAAAFDGAFVVSSAWEDILVRNEPAHGWSGQWNRDDMHDVLRGLRGLRS